MHTTFIPPQATTVEYLFIFYLYLFSHFHFLNSCTLFVISKLNKYTSNEYPSLSVHLGACGGHVELRGLHSLSCPLLLFTTEPCMSLCSCSGLVCGALCACVLQSKRRECEPPLRSWKAFVEGSSLIFSLQLPRSLLSCCPPLMA